MKIERADGDISIRLSESKIKRVIPGEFNRLEFFLKIHNITLLTYIMRYVNPNTRASNRNSITRGMVNQSRKLYIDIVKAFKAKTNNEIFIDVSTNKAWWSTKILLERNIAKYTDRIIASNQVFSHLPLSEIEKVYDKRLMSQEEENQ